MRNRAASLPLPAPAVGERHDWQTVKTLLPYLWEWKWRVIFALTSLVAAKVANVAVPLVFKDLMHTSALPI